MKAPLIKIFYSWLLWLGLLLILLAACDSSPAILPITDSPPEAEPPLKIVTSPSPTAAIGATPVTVTPTTSVLASPPTDSPAQLFTSTATTIPSAVEVENTPTTTPPYLIHFSPEINQNKIDATLNFQAKRLSVTQELVFANKDKTISDIQIVAEAGRITDTLFIRDLYWSGGMPIEDFTLDQGKLIIPLAKPVNPGEAIGLTAVYDLILPELEASLGYSPEQINLGDWHLFFPPYDQQQGWIIHEPGDVGEHLVYEMADYSVDFQITGISEPLVLVASAPAAITGENHYYFNHPQARNFSLALSPSLEAQSAVVNDILVTSYFFPEDKRAAKVVLDTAVKSLQLFEDLYGPYPHASLSILPANFRDGMEYDGLIFLDRHLYTYYNGTDTSYLPTITAHEVAHQWWYAIVANDQALEPWLDEPLATYSELFFFEAYYPDVVSWWWDRRVNYYEPDGHIDGTIYDYPEFRPYVDAVYLQGAHFLHDIRLQLGEERFLKFLRSLIAENRGERLTADIFWQILANYLPEQEISRLKERYFTEKSGSEG